MTQVFPHGAIEVTHPEKGMFKVSGQRLKQLFKGEIDVRKTNTVFHPA